MKHLIPVLGLLLLSNFTYAQKGSDKALIAKINSETEKAEHKQIFKEKGWGGNFEKTEVYYLNKTPILIVKQQKESQKSINKSTSGSHSDISKTTSAKFYIKDWAQNQYVRVGEVQTNNEKAAMPTDFAFNYDKKAIEDLISK